MGEDFDTLYAVRNRASFTKFQGRLRLIVVTNRAISLRAVILLEAMTSLTHIPTRQGPWNVDLRTPPGPEGSNGSLLDICRGHPGTFLFMVCDLRCGSDVERSGSKS